MCHDGDSSGGTLARSASWRFDGFADVLRSRSGSEEVMHASVHQSDAAGVGCPKGPFLNRAGVGFVKGVFMRLCTFMLPVYLSSLCSVSSLSLFLSLSLLLSSLAVPYRRHAHSCFPV